MERSFHIKQSIKLLSKNDYYENHHFPNQNPVKRSLADPIPWLEKPQKIDDFLQKSNDSSISVFLKENLEKLNFDRKNLEKIEKKTFEKPSKNLMNSFTFDALKIQELEYNKKEDFPLQIHEIYTLKEENKRLKAGFIDKEKAYIEEIESITKEILTIKEKYKIFEAQIEGIIEEKNQIIEKLRKSQENSDFSAQKTQKTQETESFKTFSIKKTQENARIKDLLDENKRIIERKNALECNFIVISLENERLNGLILEKDSKNSVSEALWRRKYEELERILVLEREEFKKNIEKIIFSEKNAEFFHQKSQEDQKSRLFDNELKAKNGLLLKELMRNKEKMCRNGDLKENLDIFRDLN